MKITKVLNSGLPTPLSANLILKTKGGGRMASNQ